MDRSPGLLPTVLLVGSNRESRLPAVVWTGVGLLSLAVAIAVALQPGALQDLWLVRAWLAHYWVEGANPYRYFIGTVDYPPQAFVLLLPLLLVPQEWAPAATIVAHVATLSAGGWLLARWISGRLGLDLTRAHVVALAALMFVGGGSRGAVWRGQTMGAAMLLGAIALRWATTRPRLAGVCLGLCTFKPHVAIGFALAVWLTGRRVVIAYAAAVAALLVIVFASRLHEPVMPILGGYGQVLLSMYEGPDSLPGLLSVRWVLNDLFGPGGLSLWAYLVAALVSGYPLLRAAGDRTDAPLSALLATAALVWSVVFLPYQLYGSLLVVPAVWLLMWPESGVLPSTANRVAVVAAVLAYRILDVPRSIRLLTPRLGGPEWVLEYSYYVSPVLPALMLAVLLVAIVRRARSPGGQSAVQVGSSIP